MDVNEIISILGLKPHPEGGFYRETFRSGEKIPPSVLPSRYNSDKHLCSAIYYLLTDSTFSAMHRIQTDELFHFYLGDPVFVLQLHPDGHVETEILGNNILSGQCVQCLISRGVWQGLRLVEGGKFALMGTTVAPAFDFQDFELGNRKKLIEKYPDYANHIERLTFG